MPKIFEVGEPILAQECKEVSKNDIITQNSHLMSAVDTAHKALEEFRSRSGFGRAIAAPQVGFPLKFIALHLTCSFTMFNPEIIYRSEETFTMWDDCLSFPNLMVCVRRHKHISVRYINEMGEEVILENCAQDISELLQHEIDHLHGVLALDIAVHPPYQNVDCPAVLERDLWLKNKDLYVSYVDSYVINPIS